MKTPIEQQALAVVHQMIDAWNTLDAEAILALFAEDGSLQSMMKEPHRGKAAIGQMLDYVFTFTTHVEMEVLNLTVDGNVVTLERVDHIVARGKSGMLPAVGIFEFQDGLILKWREYYDWSTYSDQFASTEGEDDPFPTS